MGVDFERLAAVDYPLQYALELVGEIGKAQAFVPVGRVAGNVPYVRDDIVVIGGVEALDYVVEIFAVHLFLALEEKRVREIDVPPADEMHGVDNHVERICLESLEVPVAYVLAEARFYAETELERTALFVKRGLRRLPLGIIGVEVNVLPLEGTVIAAVFQFEVEVVGGGKIGKPLFFRFPDYFGNGVAPV